MPQRTCVGCREVIAKRSLTRIVKTEEGIKVDPTGKASGRGAYLHNLRSCWERGLRGGLARALRTELSEQDRQALDEYMQGLPEEAQEETAPAEGSAAM